MKMKRLYIKILFSFILVLLITEILIFALFMFTAGRVFHDRFEQYTAGKVQVAKAFIEDRIKSTPSTTLEQNESLKELIRFLGDIYNAKVWLTGPDGSLVLKSFKDDIPEDISHLVTKKTAQAWTSKRHRRFGQHRQYYTSVPIKIGGRENVRLHLLFEGVEADISGKTFALGLAGIGLVIALLIIPVSRHITGPLKQLRQSAIRVAQGDLAHRAAVTGKDEIGELGRAFNHMADKLERMIQSARELTANISHELRSPLARIRVAQELLEERMQNKVDIDLCKYLKDIKEDIEELDRLISQILTLSNLDLRETPLTFEPLKPADLMGLLIERFKPVIEQKNLKVSADFSFNRPFYGDRDALWSAFSNILDNGIKFSPQKGEMILIMRSETNQLNISVTNTFEALPEMDLKRIFEPFYRIGDSETKGTGLGLAIAKKIIERHGGSIAAYNTNKGLKIEIRLPIEPSVAKN